MLRIELLRGKLKEGGGKEQTLHLKSCKRRRTVCKRNGFAPRQNSEDFALAACANDFAADSQAKERLSLRMYACLVDRACQKACAVIL